MGIYLRPKEIAEKCDFKSVVSFQGQQYIVIEQILDEICLAPAECVYADGKH